jgi:succinate dehydrogenase hydrophobic anchor subunit
LEDYIKPQGLQLLIRFLIFILWIFMLMVAVYVVMAG